MSERPTPRTDALIQQRTLPADHETLQLAFHARTLERELAAAEKERDEARRARKQVTDVSAQYRRLMKMPTDKGLVHLLDRAESAEFRAERLEAALREMRMSHHQCDDCWYSCPKSPDGCCNEAEGDECNCGADQHNAAIDAAMKESKNG